MVKEMEVTSPFAAWFEEVTLNPALPSEVLGEAAHKREIGKLVAALIISVVFHCVGFARMGFFLIFH